MRSARALFVVVSLVVCAPGVAATSARVQLHGLDPAVYAQRRNRTPDLSGELARLPAETLLAIAHGEDVIDWPSDDAYGEMSTSARAAARNQERRAVLQGVLVVFARDPDPRFTAVMTHLLDDVDPAVAGAAALRLGSRPHQEPLLLTLAADDTRRFEVRAGACAGLGAQRSEAAVDALVAVVASKADDALKVSALVALEQATSRWAFEARGEPAVGEALRARAVKSLAPLSLSTLVAQRRDSVMKRLR
jgi:hypothetical protein